MSRVQLSRRAAALALLSLAGEAKAGPRGVGLAPAGVQLEQRVGAQLPLDLRFRSGSGAPVRLGALLGRGRPGLLVLAYNRCPMLCNLVLRHVAEAMRDQTLQPGRDFDVVTVSIDPRETATAAARAQQTALALAGYEGKLERWPFLVGDERSIATLTDRVGFRYVWDAKSEQYAHPAVVTVLSASGEVTGYLQGLSWTEAELRRALEGQPQASLLSGVLQCFRPDTSRSRYGSAIQLGLRSGSALVLGALLFGIFKARQARRA